MLHIFIVIIASIIDVAYVYTFCIKLKNALNKINISY